jgi:protein ImuA
MQLISAHQGRLLTLDAARLQNASGRSFRTGLDALDALAPGGAFACAAVHELLSHNAKSKPLFVATLLARSTTGGAIIWSDPDHTLFPPALVAHGVSLDRLYLLRPKPADQTWAVAECLRSRGVAAVVAALPQLSRIEARRLQLAAEQGGGVGIFLRPPGRASEIYAAATRWLVRPAPGERTIQRWNIQLIHGHGGRLGHTVTLECCRENHLVRAFETMADRPAQKTKPPARAAS